MTVGVRFRTPVLRYVRFRGEAPPVDAFVVVRLSLIHISEPTRPY